MTVHSAQLVLKKHTSATDFFGGIYTAPPDKRTIVKEVVSSQDSAGSSGVSIWVGDGTTECYWYRKFWSTVDVERREFWTVLMPGDYLLAYMFRAAGGGNVMLTISGTELDL